MARKNSGSVVSASPTPTPTPGPDDGAVERPVSVAPAVDAATNLPPVAPVAPFGLARAAFDSIDAPSTSPAPGHGSGHASGSKPRKKTPPIDLTGEDRIQNTRPSAVTRPAKSPKPASSVKKASKPATLGSQTKLSNFFQQPPSKAKRKATSPLEPPPTLSRRSISSSPVIETDDAPIDLNIPPQEADPVEEALIAQAVAEADAERHEKRAEQNAKAAPKWNELFAKKLPPLCTVHQKPCKDFSQSKPFFHGRQSALS